MKEEPIPYREDEHLDDALAGARAEERVAAARGQDLRAAAAPDGLLLVALPGPVLAGRGIARVVVHFSEAAIPFAVVIERDLPEPPPRRRLALEPLTFGRCRLGIGLVAEWDEGIYEDQWEFPTLAAGWAALLAWDGAGDPSGWDRHPATGRRRRGGDPAQEEVRP